MSNNGEILLHIKIWFLQVTSFTSKHLNLHNLAQVGTDKAYPITWVQGIYYEYVSLIIYKKGYKYPKFNQWLK